MSVSDLVGEIEGVRRRTRRASFSGVVPLGLLGLLVCGAAPFFAAAFYSSNFQGDGTFSGEATFLVPPPSLLDRLLRLHPSYVSDSRALGLYWLVGVPVAFAAITAYYVARARRTGISLDGWRVALAGGAVFVTLLVNLAFGSFALREVGDTVRVGNFLNPFLVVAVAVFAVAWVERSVAVLLAGVGFAALVTFADAWVYTMDNPTFPWERIAGWGWATIILGGWLLLWAAGIAAVRGMRRA